MDKINDITAQKNPYLLKVKDCKGRGIKTGLLTLGLVGGVSYIGLRVPVIRQTIPKRYHLLFIMSNSLLAGYVSTAYVTRSCYAKLKKTDL